jgi:hypothetical protein
VAWPSNHGDTISCVIVQAQERSFSGNDLGVCFRPEAVGAWYLVVSVAFRYTHFLSRSIEHYWEISKLGQPSGGGRS